MVASVNDLTVEEIARRLADALHQAGGVPFHDIPHPDFQPAKPRPAAVLIPFLRQDNAWHLLYTRRTAHLAEHSGQVAFPGGRADPGDTDPEMTALREAREEIGLHPADVRILGRLHDFITITNYQVTPVIGLIRWPFRLHLEVEEVSRAFTVPLAWLADPANHEVRQRPLPPPYPPVSVIYFSPYDGELLWGVSARFTVTLTGILFNDRG
jgi:8-oxo-dGTP pyrophosphatase MutT (NUDIX family)